MSQVFGGLVPGSYPCRRRCYQEEKGILVVIGTSIIIMYVVLNKAVSSFSFPPFILYFLSSSSSAAATIGSEDSFGSILQLIKPGCVGTGSCDVRFLDLGMYGDGHAECSI
jgi:hypothetical protein